MISDIVIYIADIVVYIASHMWSIILVVMLSTAGYHELMRSSYTTNDSPLLAESEYVEVEKTDKTDEMSIIIVAQNGKRIASGSGFVISSDSEHISWRTENGIHTIYYKNAPVIAYLGPKPIKRK